MKKVKKMKEKMLEREKDYNHKTEESKYCRMTKAEEKVRERNDDDKLN